MPFLLVVFACGGGAPPPPVINEVVARNQTTQVVDDQDGHPDWVELFNPGDEPFVLANFELTDGTANFAFPADIAIPAQGFLLALLSSSATSADYLVAPFELAGDGDYLALLDAEGNIVSERPNPQVWPDQAYGIASTGEIGILAEPTPLAANSGLWPTLPALANGVVINEFHYNPQGDDLGGEFIEIYNAGAATADLSRARVSGGVDYMFADGAELASDSYWVIALDPAAFAEHYGEGADAQYRGRLDNGGETLYLVGGDNAIAHTVEYTDGNDTPGEWSVTADGDGNSMQLASPAFALEEPRSWVADVPTPGAANGVTLATAPAGIEDMLWTAWPDPGTAINVSAIVRGTSEPTLEYRVGYPGTPQTLVMTESSGRYTATIPANELAAGDLVRFRILNGPDVLAPLGDDTIGFVGTTVRDPAVTSELPIVEWFSTPADLEAATNAEFDNTLYPGVLSYQGKVYDNVQFRIRGAIARTSYFEKRNWKMYLPDHHRISVDGISYAVDVIDMQGGFADDAKVRECVGHKMSAQMGVVAAECTHVRVQHNGEFYGLHSFQEHPDAGFRARNGLSESSFYKTLYFADGQLESGPDGYFTTVVNFDTWDIPDYINMLAASTIIQHNDYRDGNFYMWIDHAEHGRQEGIIWDLDLSQGIRFHPADGITTDVDVIWNYRWPSQSSWFDDVLTDPVLFEMYTRRVRTLADQFLASGVFVDLANELATPLEADWQLDYTKWGQFEGVDFTYDQALARYAQWSNDYYAYLDAGGPNGEIPLPQPLEPSVSLAVVDSGGNSNFSLTNLEDVAIDVSSWQIRVWQGDTHFDTTLPPGAVLPTTLPAYVVHNDKPDGWRTDNPLTLVLAQLSQLPDGFTSVELLRADGSIADTLEAAFAPRAQVRGATYIGAPEHTLPAAKSMLPTADVPQAFRR